MRDITKRAIPLGSSMHAGFHSKINVKWISEHSQLNWNWNQLSEDTPVHQMMEYPHLSWTLFGISRNHSLRIRHLPILMAWIDKLHLNNPGYWSYLLANEAPRVTIKYTHPVMDLVDWDAFSAVALPADMLEYPTLPWSMREFSKNMRAFTTAGIQIITDCLTKSTATGSRDALDWTELSKRITVNVVKEHMDWPVDWYAATESLCMESMQFVSENSSKNWNWTSISKSSTIPTVLEHPKLSWQIQWLAFNCRYIVQVMALVNENLLQVEADKMQLVDYTAWSILSQIIDPNEIRAHSHLPWDTSLVSLNPKLTIQFVEENLDWPWDWESVFEILPIQDLVNSKKIGWRNVVFTRNRGITIQDLKSPRLRFDLRIVIRRINLDKVFKTMDVIVWPLEFIHMNPEFQLDMLRKKCADDRYLHEQPAINWHGISKRFSMNMLIAECGFTPEIVEKIDWSVA